MAEVEQHLSDARHADAADADEVDGADLARQFHARSSPARALRSAPIYEPEGIGEFARFGKWGGTARGLGGGPIEYSRTPALAKKGMAR